MSQKYDTGRSSELTNQIRLSSYCVTLSDKKAYLTITYFIFIVSNCFEGTKQQKYVTECLHEPTNQLERQFQIPYEFRRLKNTSYHLLYFYSNIFYNRFNGYNSFFVIERCVQTVLVFLHQKVLILLTLKNLMWPFYCHFMQGKCKHKYLRLFEKGIFYLCSDFFIRVQIVYGRPYSPPGYSTAGRGP